MSTQLMPEERVILQARQHWSVVAPALTAAFCGMVALIVVLALIPSDVGSVQLPTVKLIAGLVIGLALLVWALLRFLRWYAVTYVLTDRRIVMETGVLSRNSESIPLDRVQNTRIHRPLGDRMIGAGDIEIESAGRDGAEILHRIPQAQTFYTQLLDAMERIRVNPGATFRTM